MTAKNASIINFGCRLNEYESRALSEDFKKNGFIISGNDRADFIVINTCTVTNRADFKNRSAIRKIHNLNPKAKIIVTGCYATTDAEEIKKIPGVYSVINNRNKSQITNYLQNKPLTSGSSNLFNYTAASSKDKARAYIKIQDGCNRSCAYCKIPAARGKAISRQKNDIIDEAKFLIENNFKEIILTGINIGSFKNSDRYKLPHLLEDLLNIKGRFLIRISSIEPGNIIKEIRPFFSESSKLCRFMHIPLQSGSQKTLKSMRRGYSLIKYADIIENLREQCPEMHIGTDIITGYPGETDSDFNDTLKFLTEMNFANIHAFPFSKRKNTPIDDLLKEQTSTLHEIQNSEKKERISAILEIKEEGIKKYIRNTANTCFRGIVESITENSVNIITENYLKFDLKNENKLKKGDLINISYDEMGKASYL